MSPRVMVDGIVISHPWGIVEESQQQYIKYGHL